MQNEWEKMPNDLTTGGRPILREATAGAFGLLPPNIHIFQYYVGRVVCVWVYRFILLPFLNSPLFVISYHGIIYQCQCFQHNSHTHTLLSNTINYNNKKRAIINRYIVSHWRHTTNRSAMRTYAIQRPFCEKHCELCVCVCARCTGNGSSMVFVICVLISLWLLLLLFPFRILYFEAIESNTTCTA